MFIKIFLISNRNVFLGELIFYFDLGIVLICESIYLLVEILSILLFFILGRFWYKLIYIFSVGLFYMFLECYYLKIRE